ncbi:acetyl-CoA synthetase [Panacagrimonas perspica]|uniref:Acetyl-coenzyme A synthetase n=1 Tax=Panacagrimonas perspica TaxID=381431 RepID=A0A4V3US38_9GAMM|nr:acetate--CoA ligase [Panacagrimonas perspica]TDU32310.1 acetyl-CoA synthetase [Panacagrimonas perspica]THD05251.1 acetate--CoA ligase [Panacagrimonas perspica]
MSDIQSVLTEARLFPPSAAFAAAARLNKEKLAALCAEAEKDPVEFWAELARKNIAWQTPFTKALDDSKAPNYRWFVGGKTNASANCLDRHLATKADKIAIRFEGDKGDTKNWTYRQLHADVSKLANGLKSLGVTKGDRVVLYMPHTPEAVIAMQACARIGAIHSIVFGGFSSGSLRDRIEDAGAKVVITADGNTRGGNLIELKKAVNEALSSGCKTIEKVIVLKRTGHDVGFDAPRDVWWHDLVAQQSASCDPEWVEADHPLFLLYTSGSTGKPKGIQHSTGGYMVGAHMTSQWVFDLKESDVFWCTADVGWITGHSYVCYGPLSNGATILMYEGVPTFPDAGRFWKIAQDHGVTIFYTAPTAIRALMKLGEEWPNKYDLSKLRLLGSVGEPINPEAWMWYHRVIGKEKLPIVDTWWQTETGAIMMSPIPGATATKPGSCTQPLPGIFADVVDEAGEPVKGLEAGGYLVITKPWPSMLSTIWGDNERYVKTYYGQFPGKNLYVAGDSTHRDKDGYYWIMGRIDDVLNVSGHRLGTMEIESALVSHTRVAEAAVVGRPHEVKGESVFAFVTCKGARPHGDEAAKLIKELREHVGKEIGALAKPDDIRFADNLPKTRSGKIMRRLLRSIAKGEEITQDISTLENPGIVAQLAGKE